MPRTDPWSTEDALRRVTRALGIELQEGPTQHCPVHGEDRRPSARIYPDGTLHCFTCARGYDAVDLTMRVHKLSRPNAVARVLGWIPRPVSTPLARVLAEAPRSIEAVEAYWRSKQGVLSCRAYGLGWLYLDLDVPDAVEKLEAIERDAHAPERTRPCADAAPGELPGCARL
jgi:hypothetical protein